MIPGRRHLLSWPFATKRQFSSRFQLLPLKAVDQKCSLARMSVQSGCFNKACRLGSTADGVERREGKEKRFLKHLHSVQPVGLHVHHVMLLLQKWSKLSLQNIQYTSTIYIIQKIITCFNTLLARARDKKEV